MFGVNWCSKCNTMRSKFLLPLVITTLTTTTINAQKSRTFCVTGDVKGSVQWGFVRELNTANSNILNNIYPAPQKNFALYDALTKQPTKETQAAMFYANVFGSEQPIQDLVAALAYDKVYNRLYFTYMHGNDLRYIDLNLAEPRIYVVKDQPLKNFISSTTTEEDNITRMTFASDGYGYAITNNGQHLIRFSSGQKIQIKDLGSLTDGANNGNNSVHSACASYGGDVIGDAFGNLYLVTQKANVFKIGINSLVADFVGTIKGLPQDYTVNGVSVDDANNLVVACASKADSYYAVNIASLTATAMPKSEEQVYNASDLACGNLLYQSSDKVKAVEIKGNSSVTIYPNPVTTRSFDIQFGNIPKGNYSVTLLDGAGKPVLTKSLNIIGGQTEKVILPAGVSQGLYMISIINKDLNTVLYNDKVVIGQ